MTHNCELTQQALGLGEDLSLDQRQTVSNCPECNDLSLGFVSLDTILGTEPVPLAPANLAHRVMLAVREWRRAELRTIRLQVGMAVAAALLLLGLTVFDVPASAGAEAWVPDHQGALTYVQSAVSNLQSQLDLALAEGLNALPNPPLLLLAILIPVLLFGNWSLCRDRMRGRLT